jgi:hypothetical protein
MRNDKGQFAKGNKGKPFGATSKQNKEIRERFKMLLEDNIDTLQKDIEKLNSKDRIDAIISLASYVIPKLKATEHRAEEEETIVVSFKE